MKTIAMIISLILFVSTSTTHAQEIFSLSTTTTSTTTQVFNLSFDDLPEGTNMMNGAFDYITPMVGNWAVRYQGGQSAAVNGCGTPCAGLGGVLHPEAPAPGHLGFGFYYTSNGTPVSRIEFDIIDLEWERIYTMITSRYPPPYSFGSTMVAVTLQTLTQPATIETEFLAFRGGLNAVNRFVYDVPAGKALYSIRVFGGILGSNVFGTSYLAIDNMVIYKGKSNGLNLQMVGPITVEGSQPTANNSFSIKPNIPTHIFAKIQGSNFNNPETGIASIDLIVNGIVQTNIQVPIDSIQKAPNGIYDLSIPYQFTSSDAGVANLELSLSSSEDTDSSDNKSTQQMYVLCDVEDMGVTVPFWSQTDPAWTSDPFGRPKNSNSKNTMKNYGCSVTAFAMLIGSTKYNIKNVPLGSPANPNPSGPSFSTFGILGEALNPGNLNQSFTNYKKRMSSGLTKVALNVAIDPIWSGMAEVAQAGYKYQCSIPQNACNPANSISAVTSKAVKGIGFSPAITSSDQKLIMQNICRGNPVILKFKSNSASKQHFMLAKGFTIDSNGNVDYRLNNPGAPDSASGTDIKQSSLINKYPYIMGYSLYTPAKDPSMMSIFAPLSVDFLVTDPLGRKSGFDPRTNTSYNEIPGSDYSIQSIDTPEEPGFSPGTLVAEKMYVSSEDTPAGVYKIETFANQSGNYYLDIYKTDSIGHLNDLNYITGSLASGQVDTKFISHSQDIVPDINGELNINSMKLKKSEGFSNGQLMAEGKIKPLSSSIINLQTSFQIMLGGVNGFKYQIPATQFHIIDRKKIIKYIYESKDIRIELEQSGEFKILMNNLDLSSIAPDNFGYFRLDIDNLSADANIKLKCNKSICQKLGFDK